MSIEAPELANGQLRTEPAPVRFGRRLNQVVPHEWAEWMLTEWRDGELKGYKPPKFSDMLQRAALHFLMEDEQE